MLLIVLRDVERSWPLRHRTDRWPRRYVVNTVLGFPSLLLLRLLTLPLAIAAAVWAESHRVGLAQFVALPPLVTTVVGFLALDYLTYLIHRAQHRVPLLWRFHRVHHSDLDVDVSTAIRFHPVEILFALPLTMLAVVIAGASPATVLLYEVVLACSTLFHHSNLKFPVMIDRAVNLVLISPRAHGIHHSVVARERNANFSRLLNVWDRLHGTLKIDIRQDDIVIGVRDFRDPRDLTTGGLYLMPFRSEQENEPTGPEISASELAAMRRGASVPPGTGYQSRRESR